MLATRTRLPIFIVLLFLGSQLPQVSRHVHAQQDLPPVSYICPMDPDVLDDKPGTCPICKMDLEAVRLDLAWSCPNHAAVIATQPGRCPIDKRELVQVTVAKFWSCPDNGRILEPGTCNNGQPRKLEQSLRAHGDHNPRHGGQFFMAADKWHHLEGTYPRAGQFRLYFYDNFTKPLSPKEFAGRLVLREENNQEVEAVPLRVSRDGTTLDADIKNAAALSKETPLKVAAKIVFKKGEPDQRFDFTFFELSKEPAVSPVTTQLGAPKPGAPGTIPGVPAAPKPAPAAAAPATVATAPPAPSAAPPAGAPMTTAGSALPVETMTNCTPNISRLDAVALGQRLPQVSAELLKLLSMCSKEVDTLIQDGQFGFVYQPTMLSKDIAMALESHVGELPNQQRTQAASAIRRVVLAAWKLDLYGDLGNREKLAETYQTYSAAIADIQKAYGAKP
jgi:Heavy metal binding domain